VILNPVDGTVDNVIPITIQALDQYGNIVLNFNSGIILSTSSLTAPGALVSISNGQAVYNLHDTKHEVVLLSLLESSPSGLDISSTQDVLFASGP
jgi:hypothetical protein